MAHQALQAGRPQIRRAVSLRSDKIPPDRVVGQSPLPSEEYGVNKDVDLLVSLGRRPDSCPLPNLVGVSLDDAKSRLQAFGLNAGRIFSKKDAGRAKFQIISTSPAPYSTIRKGDVISLLVSSGSEEGNAAPADLKKFEILSAEEVVKPADAPKPANPAVVAPVANNAPPKIIVAQENYSAPVAPAPVQPVQQAQPAFSQKELSFVMPDGFMPKEVKFIHITDDGRQQVYSGTHKPLDLVKVKVPVVPNSKVQIYINDVPVEERRVEP